MGRSSDSLEAILSGSRHGSALDFTKAYDGASDAAHAVDYVGRLSGDGNSITGVWSLADADGAFEMHREAVWEEAEGQEARWYRRAEEEDSRPRARRLCVGCYKIEPSPGASRGKIVTVVAVE
jgi:hypothetical protein